MSDNILSSLCKIPANPDIAGVGVRSSIYVQNTLSIFFAGLALLDGKVTDGELDYAETQTTTNLILAFAILISSMVQARTLGITNYHANIVLSMSWMNNTNAFVYFILYIHHKLGLPEGQGRVVPSWKAWWLHIKEKLTLRGSMLAIGDAESGVTPDKATAADRTPRQSSRILIKRFVLVLGSLHLTFMAALGIWLFSNLLSFGHGRRRPLELQQANKCAVDSVVVAIAGQAVPLHSEALRSISFILYGVLLIPGVNLILPVCVFLGLYLAWPATSRGLSRIRDASRYRVEEANRRQRGWHGPWRRTRTAVCTFPARVGSWIPTSVQLEAAPAFLGLAIILAINIIFIIDIEVTVDLNQGHQEQDDSDWGFGQILAVLLLLLPLRDVVEAVLARRLKQRQGELDQDLQDAIAKEDFRRIKEAIERGCSFPSSKSPDQHYKFWNLVSTHGLLDYFDNLRRTRMTIAEKALEGDLHSAIRAKDQSRIAAAYDQGADLIAGLLQLSDEAADTAFLSSIRSGSQHIIEYYTPRLAGRIDERDADGKTALILAVETGNEALAQNLLGNRLIDVNSQDASGQTALIAAAINGREVIAKMLLKREDIQCNAADSNSMTALIWASSRGHKAIVKMLLEHGGAHLNAADKGGMTPLIWASYMGHEAIVALLLDRDDIQVNAADKNGMTPLIRAWCGGQQATAKLILERDDVHCNAAGDMDWIALMVASSQGYDKLARFLSPTDIQLDGTPRKSKPTYDWPLSEGHQTVAKMILERFG